MNETDQICQWLACLQAMELGVQLNLLCSRLDEVTPMLLLHLSTFQTTLSDSRDGMEGFLQAFLPALDAATVAHSSSTEARQAQVVNNSSTASLPALSVSLREACEIFAEDEISGP